MIGWLIETLVWTAVLIALALLVRRPVARLFGPQFAYALWAIPALRLVLPPIELPAWMGASDPEPMPATLAGSAPDMLHLAGAEAPMAASAQPLADAPADTAIALDPALILAALLAIWLAGALGFLGLRFSAYFRLRDELLEGAREVGRHRLRCGEVRLLETTAIEAPLAFGVIDKVIALPQGFLAQPDRTARDLALAHEFAHHEGRDLLVNVLVQPLFALHWWSPLGHYGWLALRRDQEAACDARVIAARPPEMREAYAHLIASFAAGPKIALAAPMACPVLGEKSIIHRLRSLSMSQTSTTRRRTGRMLFAAAILALPLTATISYAASEDGVAAPQPPQPPQPPSSPLAPTAPTPPLAPPAPPAMLRSVDAIIEFDPDTEAQVERIEERALERAERAQEQAERAQEQAERAQERAEMARERAWNVRTARSADDAALSDQEMDEIMADMREGLEEANRVLAEIPAIIEEAMAESQAARAASMRTVVKMECDEGSDEVSQTITADDGSTIVRLCQRRIMEQAFKGLKQARAQIARSEDLSANQQKRILRELDRQIAEWDRSAR
ncbi:MAG: M56 family metallopeptidase [Erythrobacter sp.]|jgi:beta-lactamase regulating signal transducer with metallopeptidase domain|nr:M56 family metallopeptidase [Erythrobacter sp.]